MVAAQLQPSCSPGVSSDLLVDDPRETDARCESVVLGRAAPRVQRSTYIHSRSFSPVSSPKKLCENFCTRFRWVYTIYVFFWLKQMSVFLVNGMKAEILGCHLFFGFLGVSWFRPLVLAQILPINGATKVETPLCSNTKNGSLWCWWDIAMKNPCNIPIISMNMASMACWMACWMLLIPQASDHFLQSLVLHRFWSPFTPPVRVGGTCGQRLGAASARWGFRQWGDGDGRAG